MLTNHSSSKYGTKKKWANVMDEYITWQSHLNLMSKCILNIFTLFLLLISRLVQIKLSLTCLFFNLLAGKLLEIYFHLIISLTFNCQWSKICIDLKKKHIYTINNVTYIVKYTNQYICFIFKEYKGKTILSLLSLLQLNKLFVLLCL